MVLILKCIVDGKLSRSEQLIPLVLLWLDMRLEHVGQHPVWSHQTETDPAWQFTAACNSGQQGTASCMPFSATYSCLLLLQCMTDVIQHAATSQVSDIPTAVATLVCALQCSRICICMYMHWPCTCWCALFCAYRNFVHMYTGLVLRRRTPDYRSGTVHHHKRSPQRKKIQQGQKQHPVVQA